jgi:hypothetical protein
MSCAEDWLKRLETAPCPDLWLPQLKTVYATRFSSMQADRLPQNSSAASKKPDQPICDSAALCRSLFNVLGGIDSDDAIASIRRRIPLLFRQRSGHMPVFTLADLRGGFKQFQAWARNLGVFATDHMSLDFRLKDAPEVRDGICSLLRSVSDDLSQCVVSL